jgi:hypothetical protein
MYLGPAIEFALSVAACVLGVLALKWVVFRLAMVTARTGLIGKDGNGSTDRFAEPSANDRELRVCGVRTKSRNRREGQSTADARCPGQKEPTRRMSTRSSGLAL